MLRLILAACSIAAFCASLCAQAAVDLNEMRVKTATKAREMTIGRQASRRFERQIKLLKDAAVLEYVGNVAQKVAASSDVMVPVTIKVVDSDAVNALSFPGGFLYITRGLILAVESEAEMAGVVAHEIAHVVARDGMKNSAYLGTGTGTSPVIIPSVEGNSPFTELGGFLIPMKFVTPPRETEADHRGIQYLKKAGYDPRGLLTFLQKMQEKEKTQPNTVIGLFQTHPPTAERVQLVEEVIKALPAASNLQLDPSGELKKIQAMLTQTDASTVGPQ